MDMILKLIFYSLIITGAITLIGDRCRIEVLSDKIKEKGVFHKDYPDYERYFDRNIEIINNRIKALEQEKVYAVIVDGHPISGVVNNLDGSVDYSTFATWQNPHGQKLNLKEASHIAEKLKGKVVKYHDKNEVVLDFREETKNYV